MFFFSALVPDVAPNYYFFIQCLTDWSSQCGSELPALEVISCKWCYTFLVVNVVISGMQLKIV